MSFGTFFQEGKQISLLCAHAMSASEGAYGMRKLHREPPLLVLTSSGSQRLALRQRMPPRQSFSFYRIQRPCLRVYDKVHYLMAESVPILINDRFREWYKEWKTAAREVRKAAASEDVDGEKKKLEKLYGDMIEMPNGYVETSAEHDGWYSKRAAQAVCRHAEARHNAEM